MVKTTKDLLRYHRLNIDTTMQIVYPTVRGILDEIHESESPITSLEELPERTKDNLRVWCDSLISAIDGKLEV